MSSFSFSAARIASLLPARSSFSAKSSAFPTSSSCCACMVSMVSFTCAGILVSVPAGLQLRFSRLIHASASKMRPSRKARNSLSYSPSYFPLSGCCSNCFLRLSEWIFVQGPVSLRVFLNQLSWLSFGQKPTRNRLQTFLSFHPSALCCSSMDLSRLGPINESRSFRASSIADRTISRYGAHGDANGNYVLLHKRAVSSKPDLS
mmetsp:Transcript_9076/g.25568  ORF Transcript_9076/g.25568 Transcript_9076/m.25568 type:complete len:204 (-) Transcript_9076:7-618(-)